jgi:hypothetical protein
MEENKNEMEMNNNEATTNVVESNCYEDSGSAGEGLVTAAVLIGCTVAGVAIYERGKQLCAFIKKKAESAKTKREAAKIVDAEKVQPTVDETDK